MRITGSELLSALASPVGRKVLTGITGAGLVVFVIIHMVGNLTYLLPGSEPYNLYAHKLMSLGWLLYALEIGLATFFLLHAIVGISIFLRKRRARPQGYKLFKSAGGASRMTLSSRSMIYTGIILLVFLVLHLISFKFGPDMGDGYVAIIEGEEVRDLHRLMTEKFKEPLYAFGYPVIMLLLGFHMRHGVWSAMQSLGLTSARVTPIIYPIGLILGLGVAVGFIVVPLTVYFLPA